MGNVRIKLLNKIPNNWYAWRTEGEKFYHGGNEDTKTLLKNVCYLVYTYYRKAPKEGVKPHH